MSACRVCDHEHRTEIDQALSEGTASLRTLEGQYNLSRSTLQRHHKEHVSMSQDHNAAVPGLDETPAFDWKALLEECHCLVVQGKALNNPQGVIHAVRNVMKFQAHLTAAVAALAGVEMPRMPRLEPLKFACGVEGMPLDNSWVAEVYPDLVEETDDAA
jgi:hypothetical protein